MIVPGRLSASSRREKRQSVGQNRCTRHLVRAHSPFPLRDESIVDFAVSPPPPSQQHETHNTFRFELPPEVLPHPFRHHKSPSPRLSDISASPTGSLKVRSFTARPLVITTTAYHHPMRSLPLHFRFWLAFVLLYRSKAETLSPTPTPELAVSEIEYTYNPSKCEPLGVCEMCTDSDKESIPECKTTERIQRLTCVSLGM